MTYPTSLSASDVWSLRDVYKAEAGGDWPSLSPAVGEAVFTSVGTTNWTVPNGVTSISAVTIGGGGGGAIGDPSNYGSGGSGGGLAYGNNISVTPGESLTVIVGDGGASASGTGPIAGNNGEDSILRRSATDLLVGGQGLGGVYNTAVAGGTSTGTERDGGFTGGVGGKGYWTAGGGGAAGYSASGGDGPDTLANGADADGGNGSGGGGGGGEASSAVAGGGGGVEVFGEGSSGAGGSGDVASGGIGGSGGQDGQTGSAGGAGGVRGGGGGGDGTSGISGSGGSGAVRIIWGESRSFPSTNTDQASSLGNVTTY